MADKRIDDVKQPDKVTPAASGRPIIVTNRPVLVTDPMMAPEATEVGSPKPPEEVPRTAKTITPASTDLATAETAENSEVSTLTTTEAALASTPADAEPTNAPPAGDAEAVPGNDIPPERDSEAAAIAQEAEVDAADQARGAELEQLIASGTYAVPINATARKRSRVRIMLFSVLGVVLILALVDVLLDSGTISLSGVPHTHFLSN